MMLFSLLSSASSEIQASHARINRYEYELAVAEARIKRSMGDQYQALMSELSNANQNPLRFPIVRRKRGGQ